MGKRSVDVAVRGLAKRHRDPRVVAQAPGAIGVLLRAMQREMMPLFVRERAERGGDLAHECL